MRFGCVIVNYRAAPLALDAALSFLGAGGRAAVIVDNASPDGSAAFFEAVARRADHRSTPPPEPIDGAEPAFAPLGEGRPVVLSTDEHLPLAARLLVIRSPRNGGFAAGCNIGLKYLKARPDIDAYLLLNPDALVASTALHAFAARLAEERAGLCGASVVGFEEPHAVQAFGGARMEGLLHRGFNLGEGARYAERPAQSGIEAQLAYPLGAAMACRRDYLDIAGFLDERYFLYFEEIDWTLEGAPARAPVWARDALVYHRYGAASQSAHTARHAPSRRSVVSDFHMTRSRILFAEKWRPMTAPLARAGGAWQAAARLLQGRPRHARAVALAALPWTRPDAL